MKKIFFLIPAGLVLALGFQSCNNDNGANDARNQQTMDSTVNARIVTLRDSMMMECNRMVMSAAQAYADSVMLASNNTGSKGTKKPSTTPSTGSTTTKPNDAPVTGKKGSGETPQVSGKKGSGEQPKVTGKKGQQPPQ